MVAGDGQDGPEDLESVRLHVRTRTTTETSSASCGGARLDARDGGLPIGAVSCVALGEEEIGREDSLQADSHRQAAVIFKACIKACDKTLTRRNV